MWLPKMFLTTLEDADLWSSSKRKESGRYLKLVRYNEKQVLKADGDTFWRLLEKSIPPIHDVNHFPGEEEERANLMEFRRLICRSSSA